MTRSWHWTVVEPLSHRRVLKEVVGGTMVDKGTGDHYAVACPQKAVDTRGHAQEFMNRAKCKMFGAPGHEAKHYLFAVQDYAAKKGGQGGKDSGNQAGKGGGKDGGKSPQGGDHKEPKVGKGPIPKDESVMCKWWPLVALASMKESARIGMMRSTCTKPRNLLRMQLKAQTKKRR